MFKDERLFAICGAKTEEGYILDFTSGGQTASRWIVGKPEKTKGMGVAAFSDRQNHHISAFRCENCGHLEFYATDEVFKTST